MARGYFSPGALALALILVDAADATCQGVAELSTDRPDFTESAVVVPVRQIQLESGLSYNNLAGDVNVISGPELLLRVGITRRIELRLGAPDYIDESNGADPAGFGDSSIGVKAQIGPTSCGWDLAAIGALSVPTGKAELTSDEIDPKVILATGRELSPCWGLGGQLMASWPTVINDREFTWGATVVMSRSLDDRWGTFAELAAEIPFIPEVQEFKLEEANEVLNLLKQGKIRGAAVLRMD